jgi:hypothetical protein
MKKSTLLKQFIIIAFLLFIHSKLPAQCTWRSIFSDGFENTNVIPGLQPGKTVHTTPQTFAAHTGTRSMYMNFVNCNGGAGACAGDKVYERIFSVCPGVSLRFNSWYTTTFSGIQCDVKLVISDANGLVLDSIQNLVAPYAPVWTNYITNTFTSTTNTIVFSMYTNVDGGNGNDLSVDDFKLEHCVNLNSLTGYNVCSNIDSVDLYDVLPNAPVNSGTWQGPSLLSGGYLGTFITGTNTGGTYIYTSSPYGVDSTCPPRIDSIVAVPFPAPVVNLINDTVICTNQTVVITAGTSASNTYNWNTGATTASITASTTSSVNTSTTYTVTVTNQGGCTETDSVTIDFVVCSGMEENEFAARLQLFPNPATDQVQIHWNGSLTSDTRFILLDARGRKVLEEILNSEFQTIRFNGLQNGIYHYSLQEGAIQKDAGKLYIGATPVK